MVGIQKLASRVGQPDMGVEHVLRRMEVPEFLGHPFLSERDSALPKVPCLKCLARECANGLAALPDFDPKRVRQIGREALDRGAECDLSLANRGIDFQV